MQKQEQTTRKYDYANGVRRTSTATSAQTAAVLGVSEILVFATQNAWVKLSADPTAAADTAGNLYLTAGEKFHLQCNPTDKLAAIRDTADGAVHILPVA